MPPDTLYFACNTSYFGTLPDPIITAAGSVTLPDSGSAEDYYHHFDNWNTQSNGTGTAYAIGDTYLLTRGIGSDTLYLRLAGDVSLVTYSAGGGTGTPPPPKTYTMDSMFFFASPDSLFRIGYTFDGWELDDQTKFNPEDSMYLNTINPTLTALWSPCTVNDGVFNYSCQGYGKNVWTTQNSNNGVLAETALGPQDDLTPEKFCRADDVINCNLPIGGSYLWSEAISSAISCQSTVCETAQVSYQGICPSGWHLPTEQDFADLNAFIGTTDFSSKVRSSTWGSGSNETGFGLVSSGLWSSGWFDGNASYWLGPSTSTATTALAMVFNTNSTKFVADSGEKAFARSVRCVRNAQLW